MPSHRGAAAAVSSRPFNVLHQKVVLRIDAAQCLVSGFTDLTLECLEEFRELRLHCRQMRVLAVHADGVPTRFDLSDPLLRVVPAGTAVSAEAFDKHFDSAVSASEDGELCVTAASQHAAKKGTFKPLVLRVEFALPRPVAGAHFVEGPGAHFFAASSRTAGPWGARLWMPCIDTGADAYPFDIYVTTHARHVVACCGVLKNHLVTTDANDQLDDNFANARVDHKDWVVWTRIREGVVEFVEQTNRLPRSVVENESIHRTHQPTGGDELTLREAFLAEWCNYQRLLREDRKLPATACGLLESIPGWEWAALRTSHYNLKQSVRPSSLVLAAGPFNVLPDPELEHVTHIGVPGRGRLEELRHTTACFPEIYSFVESFAGAKAVPRRTYQQVFVDGLPSSGVEDRRFGDGWTSGHGCTLLSSDLLHGPRSIETAIAARQAMAEAVASHSFGNVITPAGPESRWLVIALARFVSLKYLGQAFGKTYYQFRLAQDAEETSRLCDDYPPLSDPWCGNTSTPALLDFVAKRGCMILHMVESRVGADILADTIRTLAQDASGVVLAKKKAAERLSTQYFFDVLESKSRHSAKKFVEKWIDDPHMPRLQCGYAWHQRSNKTEIVLQQQQSTKLNAFQGPVDFIMYAKNDEPKELQLQMEDKVQQQEIANKKPPAGQTVRAKAAQKKAEAQKKKEEEAAAAERLKGTAKGASLLSDVRADLKAKSKTVSVEKGRKKKEADAKKQAEADAAAAAAASSTDTATAGGISKSSKNQPAGKDKRVQFQTPAGSADVTGSSSTTGAAASSTTAAAPEDSFEPESTGDSPVLWIRIDPRFLWPPSCFAFRQSLNNWNNQLRCDRDVVAQHVAVRALSEQHGDTLGCVKALQAALSDKRIFYGVRIQIAEVLARKCANGHPGTPTEAEASHALLIYFKSRFYSDGLSDPLPNDFSDFGGYFVQKALVRANASLRDLDDSTPPDQLEMLQELLQWNNNDFNPYDDSEYLSCIVNAIALIRVKKVNLQHHSVAVLRQLRAELLRYLQREMLIQTPRNTVGASCVNTLSHLDCLVHQQTGDNTTDARTDSSPRNRVAQSDQFGSIDFDLYCSCLHRSHSESVRMSAVSAVARLCAAGLWRAHDSLPPSDHSLTESAGGAGAAESTMSASWHGAAAGISMLLEICEKRDESEAVRTHVLATFQLILNRTLASAITPVAQLRAAEAARLLRSDGVLLRLGWILNEGAALCPGVREACYQILALLAVPEDVKSRKIQDEYQKLVDVVQKSRQQPTQQQEVKKEMTYEERIDAKLSKGPKTEMVNRRINITHKTMTSDKFIFHKRTMMAALPSSMVSARKSDVDSLWGDRQIVDICCDKCDKWWKANDAGLSPADTDKLQEDGVKWACPTCKKKKAAKKAKKRARESERGGGGDSDGQPRVKIKLGGYG